MAGAADTSVMGDMGLEDPPMEPCSVVEDAYQRANLPQPWMETSALGESPFDLFVAGILKTAGITVEVVKKLVPPSEEDGAAAYQAVQIVEEADIIDFMKNKESNKITLEEQENMLGIQVTLFDNFVWRVTSVNENKESHETETRPVRGGKRKCNDAADNTTFLTNSLCEIFVDVPEVGVRCTTVVSKWVNITIAFKRKELTAYGIPQSLWTDGRPLIAQRRIESCFINRHVFACQVSAPAF